MITPYYQDEQVTLHHGDCLDVLRADDYGYDWNLGYRSARMFPDNSVDAVITDPPYGIAFMGKDWDQPGAFGSERRNGSPQRTQREGLAMDAGRYDLSPAAMLNFQRWCTAWATECLRILKPGGPPAGVRWLAHLASARGRYRGRGFRDPRQHRMAVRLRVPEIARRVQGHRQGGRC